MTHEHKPLTNRQIDAVLKRISDFGLGETLFHTRTIEALCNMARASLAREPSVLMPTKEEIAAEFERQRSLFGIACQHWADRVNWLRARIEGKKV